ncbi:putative beta-galactosidase A [Colletotrichum shisoi]|uniref:Beta-galactosidase n=1 Tax=Colletotrichum shisoi TaxID=2078593 RepID=A0A5Q4BPH6_9PEZI|nr:putative beta-galactosidase A [Colletotrichum shisoi]
MLLSRVKALSLLALAWLDGVSARAVGRDLKLLNGRQQDIVTWDDKSLFINGERLMIFSAEFHAFRMPVTSLWLDILQKIKAAGYNSVSFYVNWGLIEAKPGEVRAEGIFALEPLFEAAEKAGVYLFADFQRPGPYINAEVTGGGLPGWLQRVQGALRSGDEAYLKASDNYTAALGGIIAKAQITNGGPVILFQVENEYNAAVAPYPFPDYDYWRYVDNQFRSQGVVVPYVNNEAWQLGAITALTPAKVDIYGHDSYPLGFDCWNPTVWPPNGLPTDWLATNDRIAPTSPYTIVEFQGGGFQPWGGAGFESCAALLNHEFERVLFKNNYAVGTTIFNIYMTWGGTNWGNLGHSDGYTSYDYGAQITEERLVHREKYSETKLQSNFLHVSPAYLEADRHNSSLEWTNNAAITVTPATTNSTKFYIARHTQYDSLETVAYRLKVKTVNHGDLEVPQLSDSLYLTRRDSKIHVSDYAVGDKNLVYSTAEIFTWKKYADKTVLVVYGGADEHHELAVEGEQADVTDENVIEGSDVTIEQRDGYTVLGWAVSDERKVVRVHEDLYVYLLTRNEAYNFWVPPAVGNFATSDVIVKAGYLVRNVAVAADSLSLSGDVNSTTTIQVIGGAPNPLKALNFNGKPLDFRQDERGVVTATVAFAAPEIKLPCLGQAAWKYIDSLPEIKPDYSDDLWTDADLETTYNTANPLKTPTSLYGGDYGYHTGSLLFRGRFTANGDESTLDITTQGGNAYGASVWLGDEFVGSWVGNAVSPARNSTFTLPELTRDEEYVFTVVVDNMGLNGNWVVGEEQQKNPRGILDYALAGHEQADVEWKITGNLGGEDYADRDRGPLNEGGLFVERQGYHWPSPPSESWADSGGPTAGIDGAGIAYYSTTFDLDLPAGFDIPLSLTLANTTTAPAYRAQVFVNGYHYGKFVHHVGPQTRFPVPEGVLNHRGSNHLGITLWAMEAGGAKLEGLRWEVGMVSASGFGEVEPAPQPKWAERKGAY